MNSLNDIHSSTTDWNNVKVFVTGGSRGIGAAIVKEMDRLGASVGFSYSHNEKMALDLLESLKIDPSSNRKHFCVQLDVSQEDSVERMSQEVYKHWPEGPDALVNNAGIAKDQLVLRMSSSDFESVVKTNLMGTFLVTKVFLKSLLKKKKGSIVNISSIIGQIGQAGQANYSASKAGLFGWTKSLALEVASRGIRVNALAPGFIDTDMTQAIPENHRKALLDKIPMGRMASPQEVAACVRFLLSEDSSYMTGQTLGVNGGLFMD